MRFTNYYVTSRLVHANRTIKRIVMAMLDALLLPMAFWSAIALQRYPNFPVVHEYWWLFVLLPIVTVPIFLKLGLYWAVVRYVEDKVMFTITLGAFLSTMAISSIAYFTHVNAISHVSYLLYGMIAILYVLGSRLVIRAYAHRMYIQKGDTRARVAIYGAGSAGMQLLTSLQRNREYCVVALFDDKQDLHGSEISGVKVYGRHDVTEVVQRLCIQQVFIAMPSVSRVRRQEIVRQLESDQIKIKTIPSIAEIAEGKVSIDEVMDIAIEDLLGRDEVGANFDLLTQCISGKVVMVTGAGGSIGSELCRQLLQQHPRRLILFDLSEHALYLIDQELSLMVQHASEPIEIVSILGSVTHQRRVLEVMTAFGVQTVYHVAAYKHVPLVEMNAIEGVRNNVYGTWQTALAAREAKVETFILISTDKAVRPTNVMGATKRMAELVLQALATQSPDTIFCMVRFGNVLGSSGSVVPLFRKQIRQGGPVTVTHPEITRYFMTIHEAALLVIQAGAMATGGDVFVLDMGEPVKIIDLVVRMINLSGLFLRNTANPDGDIAIEFTGLRPGEKLYEELLIGSNAHGTAHPRILCAMERMIPWNELEQILYQIDDACRSFDCEKVRALLIENVDGYTPTECIRDSLWCANSEQLLKNHQ